MNKNQKAKNKLKPAKCYVSKEKVNEEQEKLEGVSASASSTYTESDPNNSDCESPEDVDVIAPLCQPDSESPDDPGESQVADESDELKVCDVTLDRFCLAVETTILTALNNREVAQREAREERIKQQEAAGVEVVTPENALKKCVEFINTIKDNYNMYKSQKTAIAKEQAQTLETAKQQADTAVRLENIIGRIEKVQGVKAPKRPPFPSWACLAYLFWHWPMYGFSYLWLSKYFRRFCFLIAFFVMVLQFCLIFLLASDNKTLHHDRAKYVTVRNWSYVIGDTAAVNRFNKVDLLYEDVEFNKERIEGLNEFIRTRHEKNLKRFK